MADAAVDLNTVRLPVRKPAVFTEAVADDTVVIPSRKPEFSAPPEAPAVQYKVNDDSFLISSLFDRFMESHRLSDQDAARYNRIFTLQDSGAFTKADDEISQLKDPRLMGHVLYQRYASPDYKASYDELAGWMSRYADHPGAQRIYDLARKQKPKGAVAALAQPRTGRGIPASQDFDAGQLAQPYLDDVKLDGRQRNIVRATQNLLSDSPTAALRQLDAAHEKKIFGNTAYDALQAKIAQSYFYNSKFEKAYECASKSAARSGADLPSANWIAGLSAWRVGHYEEAAKYFERTAESRRSSAWMAAAGAHWAARSLLRAHHPEQVSTWLARAAEYPRTFYGIISLKVLGLEQARFNWDVPELGSRQERALSAIPAGRRALALIDAGAPSLAGAELRQINPGNDAALQEGMIALAVKAGIPDLALRMGGAFRRSDNAALYDAALYPDVPHTGKSFEVDRALVHAFIRQESKFDAAANNRSSGAVGLMQLMPATAKIVAKLSGGNAENLEDPAVNLALGQKYLERLLRDPSVDNNLFKLAVAYNAGPGKLARWEKQVSYEDDPLLFIESIPVSETRIFVERVMTNYWIYRIKYRQGTESLDRVASGEWPVYVSQDIRRGSSLADASSFVMR